MAPTPLSISESELEVLKILWEHGPATVREVRRHLHEAGGSQAYTTVQTLLTRLAQKRYVESEPRGRAHVFRPTRTREEFLGEHLDDLARKVCEGTTLPLVLSLVQGRRFSAEELAGFRELLDELEQRPGRGGRDTPAGGKGRRRKE